MNTRKTESPFRRTFQLAVTESSEVRDVTVRIGLPEPDPLPGGDFRVLLEISGFDEPYARHFHGVDELQAFFAGIQIASAILPTLCPIGGKLTWLGQDDLGLTALTARPNTE